MIKRTLAFAVFVLVVGAVYVLVATFVLEQKEQAPPTTTIPQATSDVVGKAPGGAEDDEPDEDDAISKVTNFDECAAAGNPISESYPAQCRTEDGSSFTQDIGNELEKQDLITIAQPRPTALVRSPINVAGEARGGWYFEASFPIELIDEDGSVLANAPATTAATWMTDEFVPFTATLEFVVYATTEAKLLLEKNNPSGLPEHDDSLIVPLKLLP